MNSASPPEFVPVTRWTGVTFPIGSLFVCRWTTLVERLTVNRGYNGDDTHPGWSPADVRPCAASTPCRTCGNEKPHRLDQNVRYLFALVFDYDAGTPLHEALDCWRDFEGVLHTTRKHTTDTPRFRVVLRLSRLVLPSEHARLWAALNRGAKAWGHELDRSTRNPSRFWYTPGTNGEFLAHRLTGAPVNVDLVLSQSPEPAAPPVAPDAVIHIRSSRRCVRVDRRGIRAAAYLAEMPASISGQGGHQALWAAACALVRGFALSEEAALQLLERDFNPRCQPRWSRKELLHKVSQAATSSLSTGYLLNAS